MDNTVHNVRLSRKEILQFNLEIITISQPWEKKTFKGRAETRLKRSVLTLALLAPGQWWWCLTVMKKPRFVRCPVNSLLSCGDCPHSAHQSWRETLKRAKLTGVLRGWVTYSPLAMLTNPTGRSYSFFLCKGLTAKSVCFLLRHLSFRRCNTPGVFNWADISPTSFPA